MLDVIVIGGGPAGMLAAIEAASRGLTVALLEKNEKLGKKLYITGKGRCNVTNSAPMEEHMLHIVHNPKFLFSAYNEFTNIDLVNLLEEAGCEMKEERGNRVFPLSDHASDVTGACKRLLNRYGVDIRLNAEVKSVELLDIGKRVVLQDCNYLDATSVIVATGGVSYPSTGSTGDGYRFAKKLGHSVVNPCASLVPLETVEDYPVKMQGLSLKNVQLIMRSGKKVLYTGFGEMLFTHFGVSGPLVLTASCYLSKAKEEPVFLEIDLKPALTVEQLDDRILRELGDHSHKSVSNCVRSLVPASMVPVLLELAGIDPQARCCDISKANRQSLVENLKCMKLTVSGKRPLAEAIITQGGISVKEINPKTMESKIVPGLFFAGEVLDLDAHTGGFNLQIAWSTGCIAGRNA